MIILLNCSLKGHKGNSRYFLDHLKSRLNTPCLDMEITAVLRDMDGFIQILSKADALVLGAPLYVDSLPAQALLLIEQLYDRCSGQFPTLPVYVVSNLGFYESAQIHVLLDVVKNWCAKMRMPYGGGLAIGAGGMMSAFRSIPLGKGPNAALGRGIHALAEAIRTKSAIENTYILPTGLPRFVYRLAAHTLFRRTGRKNGVVVK